MNNRTLFLRGYKTIACYTAFLIITITATIAHEADSLKVVLKTHTANDTMRVKLLAHLAGLYQAANPDSMTLYASQGLALADKIGFDKGRAICTQQIALAYYRKNEFEKASAAYRKALHLFEKAGIYPNQAAVLLSIADIYYRLGKYDTAIEYYNKGIIIAQQTDNFRGAGLGLTSIGGIHQDLGNYPEALKIYLRALGVFEKMNDKAGISIIYTNIATIYSRMGDYPRAVDYINKSLSMDIGANNKEDLLFNIVNASTVYQQMKDYKTALVICKRALLLADSVGDDSWKNACLNNVAEAYYFLEKYDSAYEGYAQVLKKAESVNDMGLIISANTGLGKVLLREGKTAEAIKYLKTSLDISLKNGVKESIMTSAKELDDASKQTGDYKNALEYQSIYYSYKDSLYNEKSDKRIQQLQYEYELDKKQQELEQNKALSQSRTEKNRIAIWSLAAGLALLVVIIILLYRSRMYEQRNKEKIIKQKEEIQEQATKLEELNNFKDKTFSVLSHDLRGPMSAFTSTITLLNEQQITTDEFNRVKPELIRQVGSLNFLLDNVLGWATSHMNDDIAARPVKTNIYHIANQNVIMLQDTAERKQIKLVNNIAETTYAMCDSGQIDIVIRNLIMNAIKYTTRNGSIILSAKAYNDSVQISVTDTGIGMTQEQQDKLFMAKPENNTYGTEGEKGIGLGLMLCYEFVKANKGAISVTSTPGEGSTFTLTLPLYK